MALLENVMSQMQEGKILSVTIGTHWTGVVVQVEGERRCGLSSTISADHHEHGVPDVPQAGTLHTLPARELAAFSQSENPTMSSVGVAAINALLPRAPETWVDRNAEEVILEHGRGKKVALIGHFPFVPLCREEIADFHVIEREPREGDLPAEAAERILPESDVVAITGMTLVNHTLENLLKLCRPETLVLVLGPSTPLSPVLYDYGVNMLSGSIVTNLEGVLNTLSQGGNFRQVHHAGVRLVTIEGG
ncbi:MAG: DUF364 domain-containing protein [Anaerolineales bacterium]|nr:DUF364 domain-containing protein [Anaerolineales bacterium]